MKKMVKVKEVMTRNVFALAPDTSLETAARLFSARHVSGAPVVDDAGRAVGVVTLSDLVDPDRGHSDEIGRSIYYRLGNSARELDLADGAVAEGVVSDVMSPFVLAVSPEAAVTEAARMMLADGVHRLLVLEEGRVVGIISTMDVLRVFVKRPVKTA